VRRQATAQVAEVATRIVATENDAPQQTREALRKRLRQYGYGIYTDEHTGMTILNVRFIGLMHLICYTSIHLVDNITMFL